MDWVRGKHANVECPWNKYSMNKMPWHWRKAQTTGKKWEIPLDNNGWRFCYIWHKLSLFLTFTHSHTHTQMCVPLWICFGSFCPWEKSSSIHSKISSRFLRYKKYNFMVLIILIFIIFQKKPIGTKSIN